MSNTNNHLRPKVIRDKSESLTNYSRRCINALYAVHLVEKAEELSERLEGVHNGTTIMEIIRKYITVQ